MTTKRKKCGKDSLMSCFVLLSFIYLFFLTNIDGFKPKCHKHVYGQKCEHVYICAPSSIL